MTQSRWIDVALAMLAIAAVVNSVAATIGASEPAWSLVSNVSALLAIGALFMCLRERRKA